MVIAIIGAGLTRLVLFQTRFFNRQGAQREARSIARAPVNLLASELRMVETGGGVVAASATSLDLLVPYAAGLLCLTSSGVTTASLLPVDSLTYANAVFAGSAWRDPAGGAYTYATTAATLGAGLTGNCTTAQITTLPGGRVITVSPALPPGATQGTVVLLLQRVRYDFAASAALPGRWALWRTNVTSGAREEIAAPYDASARFRFYASADTAQSAVPLPLSSIRGIELLLAGASENTPRGRTSPAVAPLVTAIFFRNRLN